MQGQSFDAGVYQLEVGAFDSARRRVGVRSCYVGQAKWWGDCTACHSHVALLRGQGHLRVTCNCSGESLLGCETSTSAELHSCFQKKKQERNSAGERTKMGHQSCSGKNRSLWFSWVTGLGPAELGVHNQFDSS